MSPAEWGLLGAVTLLGMTVQSTVGFGFAVFVAPAVFAVRSPQEAVTALLALGLAINLLMLYAEHRRHQADRPTVGAIFIGALPGMLAGLLLLQTASKNALQVILGATIVGAGLLQLGVSDPIVVRTRPLAGSAVTGVVGGVLTTSTGLNGPPLVLWIARHARTAHELRDTVTGSLLALNVVGAVMVTGVAGIHHAAQGLAVFGLLIPAVILGHQVGRWAFHHLDPARHRTIAIWGTVIAGSVSIVLGLT